MTWALVKPGRPSLRWMIINYGILSEYAERLHSIGWAGVFLDGAHFIKNASQRTNLCLEFLGAQTKTDAPLTGNAAVRIEALASAKLRRALTTPHCWRPEAGRSAVRVISLRHTKYGLVGRASGMLLPRLHVPW